MCAPPTHTAVRPHHVTGTQTQTETSDVTEQILTQTLKLFLNFTTRLLGSFMSEYLMQQSESPPGGV